MMRLSIEVDTRTRVPSRRLARRRKREEPPFERRGQGRTTKKKGDRAGVHVFVCTCVCVSAERERERERERVGTVR